MTRPSSSQNEDVTIGYTARRKLKLKLKLGALLSVNNHGVLLDYKILRDSATYYTNLAIYGTPTQSSTYYHSCNPTASKAIDGNTEGVFSPWCSVTLTNNNLRSWWEVDLKANSIVYSVVLFNRVDCCMDRLSNFDVILKDQSHKVLRSLHEFDGGREIIAFSMYPMLTEVRYVRVQVRERKHLSLAEVYVYGKKSQLKDSVSRRYFL